MPPFEPSSLENILNGKNLDLSCNSEAKADINQKLTPESILRELGGTQPAAKNATERQVPPESSSAETAVEPKVEQPSDEFTPESESTQFDGQPIRQPEEIQSSELSAILSSIGHLEQNVTSIADSSAKMASEVREMHKLYHNEFANRLKSMQEELERYHEIDKGRLFDGILSEVSKLYSDNESVLDDITDANVKKRFYYMLMDIMQILETYGVIKQKSSPGEKRNTRYCQVVERVATNNLDLHDTVIQSHNAGFFIENRVLIKELVDIYRYSEKADEKSAEL